MSAHMNDGPLQSARGLALAVIDAGGADAEHLGQIIATETAQHLGENFDAAQGRYVLSLLGVVQLARGRGGPALSQDPGASLEPTLAAAQDIVKGLQTSPLSRQEVEDIARRQGAPAGNVLALVRALGLARGRRGRDGGVELPEIPASLPQPAPPKEDAEKELEADWYPVVQDALAPYADFTAITADQVAGGGDWGTPDVLGVYVVASRSQLAPVRRVLAVEVKLAFTRAGLAQARSYQRFAHYAYLATPQTAATLDPHVRAECALFGVGIMCRKQTNSPGLHVLSEPTYVPADDEDVETLLARLKDEEDVPLAQRAFQLAHRTFHLTLANHDHA